MKLRESIQRIFHPYAVYWALLLLALILTVATKGDFLSARNLSNLMRQTSINGICAAGMTLVILTGGIDLSIGSVIALSGIVVGLFQVHGGMAEWGVSGTLISLTAGIATGLLCGAVNGLLITGLRIAPFVITLGMMVIARGLALIFSQGSAISPMSEGFNRLATAYLPGIWSVALTAAIVAPLAWQFRRKPLLLSGPLAIFLVLLYAFLGYKGFPVIVLFFALAALLALLLSSRTTLGRSIYAIGSNERAAYWAGVRVRPTLNIVYGLMGLAAGLSGSLLCARLNSADPNAGQLFELDAIAAVVIGGTSLRGGTGHILGSLAGALTISSLNNGMDLLGITSFYQMVFKGAIIIAAVSLDRRKASWG